MLTLAIKLQMDLNNCGFSDLRSRGLRLADTEGHSHLIGWANFHVSFLLVRPTVAAPIILRI